MTIMAPEDLNVDELVSIFESYPDIQAVYLYGSVIEGRTYAESDLDLAIMPRTGSVRARKLELLADLVRHDFSSADIVFLDTDDIVLKYEAVRPNCLIYAADDFDRGTTYSRIVRQYLDFLPYLEVQRGAYKRNILHGTTRGHSETTQ